jgi:uncharacterized protein (TIGR02453 family)
MINESTLIFLKDLKENNHREWFAENRNRYDESRTNFVEFCDELLSDLKVLQPSLLNTSIKDCIFRINRDIRFSKDKSPYKNHFSAAFGPNGRNSGKIDFYFQMEADRAFIGGGIWQPSPQNLARFRQEIDYNPEVLKSIIYDKTFLEYFGEPHGEKLKTTPKNYSADHPDIELLKFKEIFYTKEFAAKEILNKDFRTQLVKACTYLKPYLDYVNEVFE